MNTPESEFFQACNQDREELARSILKTHPSLDINCHGAIHWAALFRRTRMIDFLLSLEVQLDTFKLHDSTPLLLVMTSFSDEELKLEYMKKLLKAGAPVNLGRRGGESPLSQAMSVKPALLLIEFGADVNYISPTNQWSLLMTYCDHNNLELMKLLLQNSHFRLINHQDKYGYTALIIAVERGYDKAIRLLIQHGADYNLPTPSGRSIFEMASSPKVQSMLRDLINKQNKATNVDSSTEKVITPHSVVCEDDISKETVASTPLPPPPPPTNVMKATTTTTATTSAAKTTATVTSPSTIANSTTSTTPDTSLSPSVSPHHRARRKSSSIFHFFSRRKESSHALSHGLEPAEKENSTQITQEPVPSVTTSAINPSIPTAQAEVISQSTRSNVGFSITVKDWNAIQRRLAALEGIVTQQREKLEEQAKEIQSLKQLLPGKKDLPRKMQI